ncbi:MAG TPA: cytochrome P450 [Thermoanaerobaculia bacterium]|nr:cytochrome P450 [Thermoanaerobaculia bacterium]
MDAPPEEVDFVRELRTGRDENGPVFWIRPGELVVLDPEAAQKVNAENFADLTLPDRLVDLLRRRKSKPFDWRQVRATWAPQLRRLAEPASLEALLARMEELLDRRGGRPRDLNWVFQEVMTQALLPVVVAGLSAADTGRVFRDQHYKLARLLSVEMESKGFWPTTRSIYVQVSAGLVVRRELRGRARGRRSRQADLTDPIVDLLPVLGMDRAVDAVTAILTAIAGPPGAVAVCLAWELSRRPDWAAGIEAEMAGIPLATLLASPTRAAPLTHRFVKETLRMWSPPVVLTRSVRTSIELPQARLEVGQAFHVSTYFVHHDPNFWRDPDAFDPDRWLPERQGELPPSSSYVPFGWAPTICIGAHLGTAQLILLAYLLTRRFRVAVDQPEQVRMMLASVPMPLGFRGVVSRR